jgi:sugar/nucleoside kinase (ribokinase family)
MNTIIDIVGNIGIQKVAISRKSHVSERVYPGGTALQIALGLSYFDIPSRLIASMSRQKFWNKTRSFLANHDIDMTVVDGCPLPDDTDLSFFLDYQDNKLANFTIENSDLQGIALPYFFGQGKNVSALVHICPLPLEQQLWVMDEAAKQRDDLQFSLQMHFHDMVKNFEQLFNILKKVTYFFINYQESQMITGMRSLSEMETAIQLSSHIRPNGYVFLTNSEKGVYIAQNGKEIMRYNAVPITQEEIVDPTGAGDAFAAGVMAGIYQNKSISEASQMGLRLAHLKLRGFGFDAVIDDMNKGKRNE